MVVGVGVVIGAACLLAQWNVLGNGRAPGAQARATLTVLMCALRAYAQDHQNSYPPPDRTWSLLVKEGYLSRGGDDGPLGRQYVPAYYAVAVPSPQDVWSASFDAVRPLIYADPRFFGDGSTAVGFSDGHVDVVAISELDAIIKASGGRVEAVK